jgi:2-polyprenyl-6-methoxyphenol hydroxylase-like FAD-dependent oxidoreductase
VTIVERDHLPEQPLLRPGVPQVNHVHVLLTQGQRILEQLFPGLGAELTAAGAPTGDWIGDWCVLGLWGWGPRFDSGLIGHTCSRNLLEWVLRRRLATYDHLKFLEESQVTELLTDRNKFKVTGVRLRFRDEATQPKYRELAADLVVDATGRNSSVPKWLVAQGYQPPQKTVINSFLGYASRWYQRPEGFFAEWQGVTVTSKPPDNRRGGVLYPVEGNRWMVTLGGIGRDYPPNDEAGFLDFACSLRSPIIYEALKDAHPISPIYSYQGTENRLCHYEKLSRLPEGLVVLGDAVCTFNPVYGQGMTVAALGALTLDECLHQQFRRDKGSLKGLTKRFQRRLAQVNATPWLMATGEDLHWSTTEGGQLDGMSRLMHRYLDQVLLVALDHPKIYQTFGQVVHMVKPPRALFQPGILAQVLRQAISRTSG